MLTIEQEDIKDNICSDDLLLLPSACPTFPLESDSSSSFCLLYACYLYELKPSHPRPSTGYIFLLERLFMSITAALKTTKMAIMTTILQRLLQFQRIYDSIDAEQHSLPPNIVRNVRRSFAGPSGSRYSNTTLFLFRYSWQLVVCIILNMCPASNTPGNRTDSIIWLSLKSVSQMAPLTVCCNMPAIYITILSSMSQSNSRKRRVFLAVNIRTIQYCSGCYIANSGPVDLYSS